MDKLFDENGNYILNDRYQEILKLDGMLTGAGIPHELARNMDGWQVFYPKHYDTGECVMDAIEHWGSYGREKDLIEIMGLLTPEEMEYDSVLGCLTAEEVFNRIKAHWIVSEEGE